MAVLHIGSLGVRIVAAGRLDPDEGACLQQWSRCGVTIFSCKPMACSFMVKCDHYCESAGAEAMAVDETRRNAETRE